MNEGYAIIISSVIYIGGIVLVQFFNYRQRKIEAIERLFFETYQKKISVYDETINKLNEICENGNILNKGQFSAEYLYNKLFADMHHLSLLYSRLLLFVNSGAAGIIKPLLKRVVGVKNEFKVFPTSNDEIRRFIRSYSGFVIIVEQTIHKFCENLSGETEAEYFKEKTEEIFKKFFKKPRVCHIRVGEKKKK